MKHENGLTNLDPWGKGINNRTQDYNLPDETVRNAVNVAFGSGSQIIARPGVTKVLAAMNPRGGFSCPAGCFFVEGGKLKQFNADETATVLFSGITGTTYAFDYFDDVVYFSDNVISLKIVGGVALRWGMIPPSSLNMSVVYGSFGAGVYQALCCWVDANGLESGPSPIVNVSASGSSGFTFSQLPTTADPQVVSLRIYLSTANGRELYHVADVDLGVTTYSVLSGRYDEGNVFDNFFVSPAPPGTIIRHYNGQMYIADELGIVCVSTPLCFDHFRLGSDYLLFPDTVDIMEPVKSGIFFAYGNVTEFHAGQNFDGFDAKKLFSYGAVPRTGKIIPNTDSVIWQSQRGTIIGMPDGTAKNIQEENAAVETAISGETLIREQDGIRQVITSLHQVTPSGLAAKSWIDAEIVRRGE